MFPSHPLPITHPITVIHHLFPPFPSLYTCFFQPYTHPHVPFTLPPPAFPSACGVPAGGAVEWRSGWRWRSGWAGGVSCHIDCGQCETATHRERTGGVQGPAAPHTHSCWALRGVAVSVSVSVSAPLKPCASTCVRVAFSVSSIRDFSHVSFRFCVLSGFEVPETFVCCSDG
ncbi:hypothetical protein E2C01_072591 [Portunus trituberculatus]|uniref:Uncharacterized protein n=1 Tax=Portunus trituberculatus TaxID=210409 RepID=A0A5B7I740_PORTR|nr:hypothetical protein [Portunus trituberculatus]